MHSRTCRASRTYSTWAKLWRSLTSRITTSKPPTSPSKHIVPPHEMVEHPSKISHRAHPNALATGPHSISERTIRLPATLPALVDKNCQSYGNEQTLRSNLASPEGRIHARSFDHPNIHGPMASSAHPTMQTGRSSEATSNASLTEIFSFGMSSITKDGYQLSQEQMQVLDLVINKRKNIFFTGSAGTGKSVVLRELVRRLQRKEGFDSIAVTASTGIAALNIGGTTLHFFAGIGLGTDDVDDLLRRVTRNKEVWRRWMNTRVLIIDEVSMLSAELFDKLDSLARKVRDNEDVPWGGIQVVLAGDFLQLPPVDKLKIERETGKKMPRIADETVKFCFETVNWKTTVQKNVVLTQVLRQKDPVFSRMLNELRLGEMSEDTIKRFRELDHGLDTADGTVATRLFPRRKEVDIANKTELSRINSESVLYTAHDEGRLAHKMEEMCIAPTLLELKVGAQVMLLQNQGDRNPGLVNGSIGIVAEFTTEMAENTFWTKARERPSPQPLRVADERLPRVRFTVNGEIVYMVLGRAEWTLEAHNKDRKTKSVEARRVQIPLCLAWAITIHKCQGLTLPKVEADLDRVFATGQAYVAASRAIGLSGLRVLNFDPEKAMVNPKAYAFYKHLDENDRNDQPPSEGEPSSDDR